MSKLPFAFLLFLSYFTYGQNASISGTIKDTAEKKNINNAVVALLTPGDSILYKFTRTDENGKFILKNIIPGKYILMTSHPLYADYLDNIEVNNKDLILGNIAAINKSKLLQEVIVKTGSSIRIKGDTTIYTADSFKVSANANVEELLKKLPGIQVDKNGNIQAMGEKVEKVLVDGEEFFGDDPGMAVKNLRADAVKEVQVFDKKSDQAVFTGIDDGKTQKTINLKLKDDRKKGYFGKIDGAGGPLKNMDPRYNSNVLFGSFMGKRKISAFFLNGNTGQDGLNWQDEQKYGGGDDNMSMSMDDDGGVMMIWRGGSTDDEPNINTDNGFLKSLNAGLQYSNKWNEKQTLNFSPRFNSQNYSNTTTTFNQTQINGTALNTNSSGNTHINRYNFKNNASLELKLDSNNTIKITAKANFYHTQTERANLSNTTGETGILKNSSNSLSQTNNDKDALYGTFLWKHKFNKARRTLSFSAEWNQLNSQSNDTLHSLNTVSSNNFIQKIDQQINVAKITNNFSSKFIYTEPLSKNYSLELSNEYMIINGINNQTTKSYNAFTKKYDILVDSLTNDFKQNVTIDKPAAKINYSYKKIKFNFGSGFGITKYNLVNRSIDSAYPRKYVNIFPTASLTYTSKSNQNFRFNYLGNTVQPTLFQLQPLKNNNNYFNQTLGNPNLKPTFNNNFSFSHFGNNFLKEFYNYQGVNFTFSQNAITNSIIIDTASGRTISQPVNTNGNVSFNLYSGIGFKLKKLDIRGNLNPSIRYSRFANIINGKTSFSETTGAGMNVFFSKSKDKKYDINLSDRYEYNRNTSAQTNGANYFSTNDLALDITIYYKKVWSINSDYSYHFNQKTVTFLNNINYHIWNLKLQRTFKKDEFTAYILVRDVLNQNIGINQSYYGNTLTQTTNDRLQRYGMIGFTWNFKNKTATK